MEGKVFLKAEEILGAQDVQYREVEIPEWGGTVRLRTLTGEEAVAFSEAAEKKGQENDSAALLLAMSLVDEQGVNIFTSTDVKALKKKSLRPIVQLQKIALEMNGLTEPKVQTAKD